MQSKFLKKLTLFILLGVIPIGSVVLVASCSTGPKQQAGTGEAGEVQYVHEDEPISPPSWANLAAEMGFASAEELQAATESFVGVLVYGKNSKHYAALCGTRPEVCVALDAYIADNEKAYKDRRQARNERRKRRRRFRLRPRAVNWAQRLDIRRSMSGLRIRSSKELMTLGQRALKTKSCPRNLSAALSLRAAKYFPDQEMFALSEQLFDHAEPCLQNSHRSWEILHLRQGLHALWQQKYDRAERLLSLSLDGPTSKEDYRAIYWLGWIANERGVQREENNWWQQLIKRYPLSYYSIDARNTWNVDSFHSIPELGPYAMERRSKLRPEINQRVQWLEALHLAGERRQFVRWIDWMDRDVKDIEPEVIFYLSSICLRENFYRQNIALLYRYFNNHPDRVNRAALRRLFPRPFFDNVHEESKDKIHTNLVMSLIRQESAFDPRAVSPARAKGLMQIIPRTARRLMRGGHRKLFNPELNTKMGIKYLVRLSQQFDSQMELVLAAYNAGPRRVDRWLKRFPERTAKNALLWNDLIPFMETRDYVVSILRNNYWYERLYGPLDIDRDNVLASKLVDDLITSN